jgi:surface polysaccharide O-acyltransferase-like enzyme
MQTNPAIEQSRFRWVDLIRALGVFLIVLAQAKYAGSGAGVVRDFYYALTRAAIPLFFMTSGYLLLSKNEAYSDFFRKRAVKVFIPVFVWSAIYLLWRKESFDAALPEIIKTYLLKIARAPVENHLRFFYELFGLYLFTPILRVYLQKAERKDLYYFCGAWFLLIPVVEALQTFTPVQIGFAYDFLAGYAGYFLFGYLAGTLEVNDNHRHIAWIVFLEGLIVTVAGLNLGAYYEIKHPYFEDYFSLGVVVMACALFVALRGQPVSDSAYRLIAPLSRASFGIYLAHALVMTQLLATPPFSILAEVGANVYAIPLLGLLGFGGAFLLIFILQKIPILKRIVP